MKNLLLIFLTALSLLAVLVSLYTTSTGTGLGPDSYVYLASARSLLKGQGVRIPQGDQLVHTAHFPPLYAGMLALSSLGAFDPLVSARWLNAFLFGANLFLVGLAIYRLSRGSALAAGLGAAVFLGADGLLQIHAQVWSEPPFFTFTLLSLLLLSLYLEDPKPTRLAGAGVAAALACLVRYAGAVLVLAGAAALLLQVGQFGKLSYIRERLKPTALFLALGSAPAGAWMLYNLLVAGSLADRSLSRHPVSLRDLGLGVTTVASWIFPGVPDHLVLDILALAAMMAGLAGLCLSLYRSLGANPSGLQAQVLPFELFTLAYLGFLLLLLSLFDAQTSLDGRILSPIYITCLILGFASLARWLPGVPVKIRWAAYALLVIFAGAQLFAGARMALGLYHGDNKGYTSQYWLNLRLLKLVGALPPDVPIFSNGSDVIYLLTGKPAIGIPREISPNTLKVNPSYKAEIQAMRDTLLEKNGVLVLFDKLEDRRLYLPTEFELNELLPLKRLARWENEGVMYRLQK